MAFWSETCLAHPGMARARSSPELLVWKQQFSSPVFNGQFNGLLNEVASWLLIMQKNLQGFGPGLVDLFPADLFVAIAKVQAYEANELL